jgi:hypothetical protein
MILALAISYLHSSTEPHTRLGNCGTPTEVPPKFSMLSSITEDTLLVTPCGVTIPFSIVHLLLGAMQRHFRLSDTFLGFRVPLLVPSPSPTYRVPDSEVNQELPERLKSRKGDCY